MSKKRALWIPVALGLTFLAFTPSPVLAWSSECSLTPPGSAEQLICAESRCPAYTAPNGHLLGEHALIAREAMELVGLSNYVNTAVLEYYRAPNSLEPGAIGQMSDSVSRMTIPEFSQVPDYSYGLADFILGNEHCFLQNTLPGIRNNPVTCHNYATHLGPLNSTHFPPQARAVYEGYHKLALDTAAGCAQLADAIENMEVSIALPDSAPPGSEITFPNDDFLREQVLERCELEALAIEAVGAHYSSDVWSMGHMWERWGAPALAPSSGGQARQFAVALQTGVIHGAREVIGKHDQMNAPGPWVPGTAGADPAKTEEVRFHSGNATLAGAGDGYLLECTSGRPIDDDDSTETFYSGSMQTSPELQETRSLMLSCLARGFQEVYEAGPQTSGDLNSSPDLHPAIQSSQSERCWNLRADNLSMWLGAGISDFAGSRDPAVWGSASAVAGTVIGPLFNVTPSEDLDGMALDMAALYLQIEMLAEWFPDGSQSASFPLPILGLTRNSAAVSQIQSGRFPQLDRFDRDDWAAVATGASGCDDDADCAPDEYCQVELDSDGAVLRSCVEKEVAILRALRGAELRTWCEASKLDDLQRAAQLCKRSQDAGGAVVSACISCAELVLPHLRNACDEGSYDPEMTGRPALLAEEPPYFDHRSMCDIAAPLLSGDPLVVYAPYDPAEQGTAPEAAWSLCESGFVATDPIQYAFDEEPPPVDEALNIDDITLWEERSACGAAGKVHWFRLTHDPDLEHLHELQLAPGPLIDSHGQSHTADIDALQIDLFSGEDCEIAGPPASLEDTDQDGVADAWIIQWETGPDEPHEVCLRVTASEYDAWTNYVLSEADEDAGDALFVPLIQRVKASTNVEMGTDIHRTSENYYCREFQGDSWSHESVDVRWNGDGENSFSYGETRCDPGAGRGFSTMASGRYDELPSAAEENSGSGSASAGITLDISPTRIRISGFGTSTAEQSCVPDVHCYGLAIARARASAEVIVRPLETLEAEIRWDVCGLSNSEAQSAAAFVLSLLRDPSIGTAQTLAGYDGRFDPCQGVTTRILEKGVKYEISAHVRADTLAPIWSSAGMSTSISVTLRPLAP